MDQPQFLDQLVLVCVESQLLVPPQVLLRNGLVEDMVIHQAIIKKILSHEEDLRGCIKLPASTESVLQFAHPLVARLTLESDRPLNQIPFFVFNFLVSNFSQNHLKKKEKKNLKFKACNNLLKLSKKCLPKISRRI